MQVIYIRCKVYGMVVVRICTYTYLWLLNSVDVMLNKALTAGTWTRANL